MDNISLKLTPEEITGIINLLPFITDKVNVGYKNAIIRNDFPYDLFSDPVLLESFKRAVKDFDINISKVYDNNLDELSMQQIDDVCLMFISISNDASKNPALKNILGNSLIEYYKILMGKRISKFGIPEYYSEKPPDPKPNIGACFIATSVYGDYNHPQVIKLRDFRDNKLSLSRGGRLFLKYYYYFSPSLVKKIKQKQKISNIIKTLLNLFIYIVE